MWAHRPPVLLRQVHATSAACALCCALPLHKRVHQCEFLQRYAPMSPILLRTASQLLCWRSPFACSCAVWACRSWSLHVTNFKRRLLQMAVELRADNTLGLFDLQRDGLGGCCMGAARWPHVVALAAERWRGRNYKLWPVADRQVARVWSARGLQAASGDHVPTLSSLLICISTSLYFSPAPPAPLPAHTEAEPALYHHRGSPPARARPQVGLPARRRGRSRPLLRMAAASGPEAPDGGCAGGHFGP